MKLNKTSLTEIKLKKNSHNFRHGWFLWHGDQQYLQVIYLFFSKNTTAVPQFDLYLLYLLTPTLSTWLFPIPHSQTVYRKLC